MSKLIYECIDKNEKIYKFKLDKFEPHPYPYYGITVLKDDGTSYSSDMMLWDEWIVEIQEGNEKKYLPLTQESRFNIITDVEKLRS